MTKNRQVKKENVLEKTIAEIFKEIVIKTIVVAKGKLFWGDKELKIAAKGEPGDKGDPGYTPVKDVDYFDGKDGHTPVKGVDYFDGKTPVKGVDYYDGKDGVSPLGPEHEWNGTKIRFRKPDGTWGREVNLKGKDGYTPVKDVDYFDGKDGHTPVKGVDYFDGKHGHTPVKGVDYTDGKDGITPIKDKDYFDGKEGYTPVKGKDYFDGKKGDPGKSVKGKPGIMPNDLLILIEDVNNLKKRIAKLENDNS